MNPFQKAKHSFSKTSELYLSGKFGTDTIVITTLHVNDNKQHYNAKSKF